MSDQSGAEVNALSIPTVLEQLGLDRIGLLKVDIKGYEGILLRPRCVECQGYGDQNLSPVKKVALRLGRVEARPGER
jgi:hypothetical protein